MLIGVKGIVEVVSEALVKGELCIAILLIEKQVDTLLQHLVGGGVGGLSYVILMVVDDVMVECGNPG